MFDWFSKKKKTAAPTSSEPAQVQILESRILNPGSAREPAAKATTLSEIPYGRWVWMSLPWQRQERFLGYVYLDQGAGPSAKGGPETEEALAEQPTVTVRLPLDVPMGILSAEEITARKLPPQPSWLSFYGAQPSADAPWRHDPALRGAFHPECPDDLQVFVHDGEPRRTERGGELCWVRVTGVEEAPPRCYSYVPNATELSEEAFRQAYETGPYVYLATLLNAPHALQSVKEGDTIRFLAGGGLRHPLLVTASYLQERARWRIAPCSECGAGECLDPPTVMAKVRFPDAPPGAVPQSFTAFCAMCGGIQLLSALE